VKKLAARMAPIILMGYPLLVYRDHMGDLVRGREWVSHTVAARQLAERMGRQAGCTPDPAGLRRTLDEFAETTRDNPAQVQAARAMLAAIGRGDLAEVSRLADAAAAEEERLLAARRRAYTAALDRTRGLADMVFGFGVATCSVFALVDYAIRRHDPSPERAEAILEDARVARRLAEERNLTLINSLNDLRRELSTYQGVYGRDLAFQKITRQIERLDAQLDAFPGEKGGPDGGQPG
jgi:hypothetical protein